MSQSQLPRIKNKGTLSVDLQLSIEKHNRGENPIPYLIGILDNYDKQTRWEIMAQICSYTILFSNNLKNVMNYFMMLVEAQEIGEVKQDLILVRILIREFHLYRYVYLKDDKYFFFSLYLKLNSIDIRL